jgi:hypothetical protein
MLSAIQVPPIPQVYEQARQWFDQLFFIVQVHFQKSNEKAVFLSYCGGECYTLLSNLIFPDTLSDAKYIFSFKSNADATKVNLRELLLQHLKPKMIMHYERYKFFHLKQENFMSTQQFLAMLRKGATTCDFGTLADDLLLTQFVNGICNANLQKKLLTQENLTLDMAIQTALVHEASSIAQCSSTVAAVKISSTSSASQPSSTYVCFACGKSGHFRDKCKFKNAKCGNCGRNGHITVNCRRKTSTNSLKMESFNQVDADTVFCSIQNDLPMYKRVLLLDGKPVNFLVDTGSPVTIVPKKFLQKDKILVNAPIIRCYSGMPLKILGISNACLTYGDHSGDFEIFVIESSSSVPILGCNVLNSFKMIQIAPIVSKSGHLCAEIITKCDFNNTDIQFPKFKPRSLPYSIRVKVEDDIKDKVKNGILVPVEKPLMACPVVPVVKPDGSVRVCGDYSVSANKYIDAEQYKLPTLDEITTAMVNCKIFSKLDLKHAYLQLPLTDESQKFTTISTTLGFYNFTKLPFGISAAPRIFQQFVDKIIQVPNVKAYQDDILIGGTSKEDHDGTLRKVFEILKTHNLSVNKEKSELGVPSVHFLGFILSGKGLHPDPERLVQLQNIRSPSDAKQLKSIIGTLQFYSRFASSFSSMAAPLFRLLSPRVPFKWTSVEESALRNVINGVSLISYLVHYDIKKPLYLTTDASLNGLGAVLSHDPERRQIIHCASRVLTDAEKKYANIEKEALGVVFGVKRFHQYLAGRHFIIQADHAPLRYIFDNNKPVNDRISARLQRWCLVLKSYDFSVFNIKGEEMFLPDFLSRVQHTSSIDEDELIISFTLQENEIPLFKEIQTESKSSEIAKIIQYVQKKWPLHIPQKLMPYSKDKWEYTVHNGCLYRGFKIVVPPVLRAKLLELFHEFHPGMARMRQIMRQFVWWPGIDGDIQKFVASCIPCLSNQASRSNCNLSSWPDCSRFFQRLFIDICFHLDKQYLILIDGFSNFIDVHELCSLTSQQVILALHKTFRYYGLPDEIVCDNGKQFLSQSFQDFLKSHSIELLLTPPYHSQSNGKVERAIRTFKLFLNKNQCNVNTLKSLVSQFCMIHNFFPNSNGTIPCREYLQVTPRVLMTKILISDKRGINEASSPQTQLGTTVVPVAGNRVHSGGVIEIGKRNIIPNRKYFNADYIS